MKRFFKILAYRLAIFALLCGMLFISFFCLQGYLKKNGNVRISADNVSEIKNISASGIVAYMFDYYTFPANTLTFSDDVILVYAGWSHFQYMDHDGHWVNVDELLICPNSGDGSLRITSLPARVDYSIGLSCLNKAEDPLVFPCSMEYSYVSASKFKYEFTAPYMNVLMHFQDNNHTDVDDTFFVDFYVDNCIVYAGDKEITGPFRINAYNISDSGFDGEIWSMLGFGILSKNNTPCIKDIFSGSEPIEDEPHSDVINFQFASEIDAIMEGDLSFRYGSSSSEYRLFSEPLYANIDDEYLENEKNKQIEYFRYTLNWGDGKAWFESDVSFKPNLVLEATSIDNKRQTTFQGDYDVNEIEIDGTSLLPNLKTLLTDNAMNIELVPIILAIIAYVFPTSDKLPIGKNKQGKYLKS